jgi:hypothetical protein
MQSGLPNSTRPPRKNKLIRRRHPLRHARIATILVPVVDRLGYSNKSSHKPRPIPADPLAIEMPKVLGSSLTLLLIGTVRATAREATLQTGEPLSSHRRQAGLLATIAACAFAVGWMDAGQYDSHSLSPGRMMTETFHGTTSRANAGRGDKKPAATANCRTGGG